MKCMGVNNDLWTLAWFQQPGCYLPCFLSFPLACKNTLIPLLPLDPLVRS